MGAVLDRSNAMRKVVMRSANLRAVLIGIVVAAAPLPALAFENFDQGKSPQQVFASDCAICHHSASGLGAKLGPSGLTSFLSEHYTASRDVASAIAAYLTGQGGAAPSPDERRTRISSKREESGRHLARKPASGKSDSAKSENAKSDTGTPKSARHVSRTHKPRQPVAPSASAKPSAGGSSPDVTGSTSKPATSEKGN